MHVAPAFQTGDPMKFSALALDYDGTIALDGILDPTVREAIAEARQRGIAVILPANWLGRSGILMSASSSICQRCHTTRRPST